MALPRGEFTTLLRELRAAGPVERVRLLARSLKALRGLSPWDRKVLLRMAGFEGAETLVERLAHEDEETAARLQGLLGELEGRPDELEETVRSLADPARRTEAVDRLLATLDRGLGGGGEEPADETPSEPPSRGSAPEGPPGPVPEAPPGAPSASSSTDLPEALPVPERAVPLAPPVVPGDVGRASGPPADETPVPREPAPPPEAAPKAPEPSEIPPEELLPAEPAPGEEPVPREEEPEPVKPPTAPPVPPAVAQVVPEVTAPPSEGTPTSAPDVLERLLSLRRRAAGGEGPDAAELARTLEAEIPFPWARRRAVQAWIEGSGAGDLDGALRLIAGLSAPTDRTWCLADLAEGKEWSNGEWRRIVEVAPSPAARRRLERRRKAL